MRYELISHVNRIFMLFCVAQIFHEWLKARHSSMFQTILHDFTSISAQCHIIKMVESTPHQESLRH